MNYKNYFNKALAELGTYKNAVKGVIAIHSADMREHEAKVAAMRGKYTEEYIDEYCKTWKSSNDYEEIMSTQRGENKKMANFYLDLIKEQIDNYFQAPVNSDFANKVMAIKTTGMRLSQKEFDLLQDQATSYMERRLLNELARTSDSEEKDGTYLQLSAEVPDIDSVYKAYNSMRNNVNTAFDWYCGDNLDLKEYIGYESGNFAHAGNVTHAIKCFDIEKNDSYKNFSKVMDKANDILKESDKTSLTDDDKALINAILPDYDKYPSVAKSQAVEIAKSSSKMATLLMLDERYNETVSEALES